MKVSVLDQTILQEGQTPEEAFRQTVENAQFVDELGYSRYWVSEHHSTDALGGSSPEALVGYLAAKTNRIRVGSGGVMLAHYSAYKVAETFRVLSALAPGRIDLGVGRAPGGVPLSTRALQDLQYRDPDTFPDQLKELLQYLKDILPHTHPLQGLMTTPRIDAGSKPDVWLLGTSPFSGELAGRLGLPYAFAHFSPHQTPHMKNSVERYYASFQPGELRSEPYFMPTFRVVVADTDEEAAHIAGSALHFNYFLNRGRVVRMVPPEALSRLSLTPEEKQEMEDIKDIYVMGSPDTVRMKLKELQAVYHFEEMMALQMIPDIQQRRRSYKLLKEVADSI
ncbi:LLM class flavin-dependent oxidoreductase [Paenibacillus sp. JX-17]|uniref:LLM class flavin-dependent oxidoreductase n=1 Tax=Paenibacillus lacisoli TaxID=3064525 RepID=A0ABT9C8T0_9BACL|nr:LLM class flavin-dependent oxidoreductase [Paenibacillus sp. JX-17]MDO7905654.1 LLM class flavin-dependent oxidoreductase [Paenibacillus sp. JX-17]